MRKNANTVNWPRGFTLIEVVVVMAIIAVLAALVVGAINVARNTAKETAHRSNAKTLEAGMQAYYASHRTGPIKPPSGGSGGSFTYLANILGVQLSPAPECDGVGLGNPRIGGGAFWVASDPWAGHYLIAPYTANCYDELPAPDKITGEMPLPPT